MKWLFRLILIAALAAGIGYFIMNYDISSDKDGIHIKAEKDKKWDLADGREVVEKIKDKAENVDWDQLKKKTAQGWSDISKRMSDFADDFDLDQAGESAQESIQSLQEKAKKKYDKLVKKWEDGDYNFDAFQEKLKELNEWISKQMAEIKEKFESK